MWNPSHNTSGASRTFYNRDENSEAMEVYDSLPPPVRARVRTIWLNAEEVIALLYVLRYYDIDRELSTLKSEDLRLHEQTFRIPISRRATQSPSGDEYFPCR